MTQSAEAKAASVELDDAALVAAYRGGAEAAFAELVRRHQIPVFRLLLGLASDADEAELLCEAVFFEAAKRIADLPDGQAPGAWLLGLAREVTRKAEEKKPKAAPKPKRTGVKPRDPKALVKQEVKSALGELSGDERVALILADLEGDSFESIGQTLGTSAEAAEAMVRTARTKFERGLAQHDAEPERTPGTPADTLQTGAMLGGRFRIEGLLGKGGMGAVYRATDTTTGQLVALKTLLPSSEKDTALRRRFAREAEIIERLQHPNFVRLIDHGGSDGEPSYVAMELVDGDALSRILERESRLAPKRALHIARHVLSGLTYAHGQGVIHRDLKPENVMLTRQEADADFAKVLDLGIAKLVGPEDARKTRLTQQGELIGTPLYISPEMLRGEPLDARADLYSLTILLYEMLASRPPFDSTNSTALFAMHLAAPPPLLADAIPELEVPPQLEQLLQQGMAKEPAKRVASAETYLRRVDELLRVDWDKLRRAATTAAPRRARKPAAPADAPAPAAAPAVSAGGQAVWLWLREHLRSRSSRAVVVLAVLALIGLFYWVTRDITQPFP
ncbi:MAG TPA: protein kinase [Polyangiaceae bacterium]|nr:protein kinase [Polyangiaceae bacterium]